MTKFARWCLCMHRVNRSAPWKVQSRAKLAPDLTVCKCQKGRSGRLPLNGNARSAPPGASRSGVCCENRLPTGRRWPSRSRESRLGSGLAHSRTPSGCPRSQDAAKIGLRQPLRRTDRLEAQRRPLRHPLLRVLDPWSLTERSVFVGATGPPVPI